MEDSNKKYGAFISYSHEDAQYIDPIVKLIKAMRSDFVFQDNVDLKPGTRWEPQLKNALDQADIIIVFWCVHSANSDYVKKEYETAITSKKDVLPLLLDDTKLVAELAAYQWIDFRYINFHTQPRDPDEIITKGLGGIKNSIMDSKIIASIIKKKLNERFPS